MSSKIRALSDLSCGLRAVVGHPSLVLWVYFFCLLCALPLATSMSRSLQDSFGESLVEARMRTGFDVEWWGEFQYEKNGVNDTFGPWVIGHLLPVSNIEKALDGEILDTDPGVVWSGLLFLGLFSLLLGGILSCFADPGHPLSRGQLLATGSQFFFRLLRLLLIALALYWMLFRYVAEPLQTWLEWETRNVTVERTVMLYTGLLYALIGGVLLGLSMFFDYARIAIVTEHRRSVFLALLHSVRFVLKNPIACVTLYLGLLPVSGTVLIAYLWMAPGPGQSSLPTILGTFLFSQIYLLARIVTRLWFLASQTALYRRLTAPVSRHSPVPPTSPPAGQHKSSDGAPS